MNKTILGTGLILLGIINVAVLGSSDLFGSSFGGLLLTFLAIFLPLFFGQSILYSERQKSFDEYVERRLEEGKKTKG